MYYSLYEKALKHLMKQTSEKYVPGQSIPYL